MTEHGDCFMKGLGCRFPYLSRPAGISSSLRSGMTAFCGFALFLLLFAGSVTASDDENVARQWLERMMKAVRVLEYQGTFIYLHDNQLETMRIIHAISDGQPHERLISLNGAPREVIRDRDSVTCVMPESQQVSIDKRPPTNKFLDLLPENLEQLSLSYAFRTLGETRVADRQAKVVAIIPRDGFRYGYRFYLDQETALPLKSDLMNEEGEAVEQTMFTELEVGTAELGVVVHKSARKTVDGNSNTPERTASSVANWSFRKLPAGFTLSVHDLLPNSTDGGMIEHYVLSDGLASLSLFIEPIGQTTALEGVSRLGAINAWGGQVDDHQVTAVGEVPAVTLLSVVKSMRRIQVPND